MRGLAVRSMLLAALGLLATYVTAVGALAAWSAGDLGQAAFLVIAAAYFGSMSVVLITQALRLLQRSR